MSKLLPRAADHDEPRARPSMVALVFGFTVLGVPLIVFVALHPTTVVVIAAFAVQLVACVIGVLLVLRAFSDDGRPDEPQPDERKPEIARRPLEPDSLLNHLAGNEPVIHPASTPAPPTASPDAGAGVSEEHGSPTAGV
jgi:hypothetical protein